MEVELARNHIFLVRHGAQPFVGARVASQLAWQPAVDVYRCADGWLIKFELAGVRQEDVRVESNSRGVTISGVRRDAQDFEWKEIHLMEIAYSRFERSVQLPESVENMQLIVEYRNGMMYVRVFATNERNV
jgi:HSP20 family protein